MFVTTLSILFLLKLKLTKNPTTSQKMPKELNAKVLEVGFEKNFNKTQVRLNILGDRGEDII